MLNFFDFSPVKKTLATAQSILVALPLKPNKDKVASALGLFLSFKRAGKEVSVVCPDQMTVEFSDLVGVDKIDHKIGGKNLVISFGYVEDSIEKVSYNIEGGRFNLVIQPKEGFPPLSTDKVDYSSSGSRADLIFIVGSSSFNGLGEIYQKNPSLFEKKKVVNLDNDPGNTQFGGINLVNPRVSSCSELVTGLLSQLEFPVDADIASDLFYGLEKATRNFSSPRIGPDTFEAAAFCLRAGARRQMGRAAKIERKRKTPLEPMPTLVSAEKPPEKPSPDWLEPKIYKGDTHV